MTSPSSSAGERYERPRGARRPRYQIGERRPGGGGLPSCCSAASTGRGAWRPGGDGRARPPAVAGREPLVLADGAHNPDGVRRSGGSLALSPPGAACRRAGDDARQGVRRDAAERSCRWSTRSSARRRASRAACRPAELAEPRRGRSRPAAAPRASPCRGPDPHAAVALAAAWPAPAARCSSPARSTCWRTSPTCSPAAGRGAVGYTRARSAPGGAGRWPAAGQAATYDCSSGCCFVVAVAVVAFFIGYLSVRTSSTHVLS